MKRNYGVRAEFRLLLTVWLVGLILWVVPMSTPEGQRLVLLLHAWLGVDEVSKKEGDP